MLITVLSLKEVKTYRPTQLSYLIRIFGNEESYHEDPKIEGYFLNHAVYFFDDVDLYLESNYGKEHLRQIIRSEHPQLFHKRLALKIISEFDTRNRQSSFDELVVHCYLGAGRSPAVAMALNEIFQLGYQIQDLINRYPEYNQYVFEVMVQTGQEYLFNKQKPK